VWLAVKSYLSPFVKIVFWVAFLGQGLNLGFCMGNFGNLRVIKGKKG
jgi:hypothetical protein